MHFRAGLAVHAGVGLAVNAGAGLVVHAGAGLAVNAGAAGVRMTGLDRWWTRKVPSGDSSGTVLHRNRQIILV